MRGDRLASASINVGEIYGGMLSREEIDAEALFEALYIYPLTTSVARDAGRLQFAWARRGKTLDLADMIVAATALEYGLTLMTDNRKDFPMPELKFVDLP